jgi:hypothetical protein
LGPMVEVTTLIDPTVGVIAVQEMVKLTVAVAPAVTVTLLESASPVQLDASPLSATVWSPTATSEKLPEPVAGRERAGPVPSRVAP